MLWTIGAAVLAVLGFVLRNDYLYIGCGFIAFISLLAYLNHDFEIDVEARYADLKEDYPDKYEGLIRQERCADTARRVGLFILVTGIYSWLFSWQIMMWSGILFGFYLIPRFIKSGETEQECMTCKE